MKSADLLAVLESLPAAGNGYAKPCSVALAWLRQQPATATLEELLEAVQREELCRAWWLVDRLGLAADSIEQLIGYALRCLVWAMLRWNSSRASLLLALVEAPVLWTADALDEMLASIEYDAAAYSSVTGYPLVDVAYSVRCALRSLVRIGTGESAYYVAEAVRLTAGDDAVHEFDVYHRGLLRGKIPEVEAALRAYAARVSA